MVESALIKDNVRVLVADDDPMLCALAATKLHAYGYDVEAVLNGRDAWARLTGDAPFDLVITDLDMPGMSGFDLIAQIRRSDAFQHLPIIVITGLEDADACEKALLIGATGFLTKPLNWTLFVHQLLYVLRNAQRENDLVVARGEAERASKHKDNLFSLVSHELRTPLNVIEGFSKLLVNEPHGALGDPAYRDYAAEIFSAGEALERTVSELIFVSKILSGSVAVDREDYRLADLVGKAVKRVEEQAKAAGVRIEIAIAERSAELACDRDMVCHALYHLLKNALAASPADSVITVSARPLDDGARFSVSDRGSGIEAERLADMFEPFVQGADPSIRATAGMGLGLTIVRSIARAHDGNVFLESTPGQGTLAGFDVAGPSQADDEGAQAA